MLTLARLHGSVVLVTFHLVGSGGVPFHIMPSGQMVIRSYKLKHKAVVALLCVKGLMMYEWYTIINDFNRR